MLFVWNKNRQRSLIISLLILVGVFLAFFPNITNAQTTGWSNIGSGLEKILLTVVNVFFGWMVWVGGLVLNMGINDFVIGFGEMYANKGLGQTIDGLWVVVRDIFNLTFIFGLVFIGLKMIMNSSDSGNRSLLVSLIMAALLVNFSLFITKFVVDFSNIATYQLVKAFIPDGGTVADVSGSFAQLMGLPSIFNFGTGTGVDFSKMVGGAGLGYIFGTMILYIISAFVFLGGGLLLMIRFVALSVYMVLSPIMFIGMVFPGMASVSKEYWKGFLSRAFFAPAYILMLYLAHKILSTFAITAKGQSLSTIFTADGKTTFAMVVPPFILTSIFLIAAIVVAQKMSANGGSAVISAQNAMMGRVKKGVQNTAMTMSRPITKPARMAGRGASTLVRNRINNTGEGLIKKLNTAQAGSGFGAKVLKTNVVDRAMRGNFEAAAGVKLGTGQTSKTDLEYRQKTEARANQTAAENIRQTQLKDAQKALDEKESPTTNDDDLKKALESLGKVVRDMSKEEKEGLKLTQLVDKNIAIHLSDSDIENIEKSGKYGAADIKTIKDARSDAFKSLATHGTTHTRKNAGGNIEYAHTNAGSMVVPAGGGAAVPVVAARLNQRADISKRSVKDVGKMPVEMFTQKEMYAHLTPAMVEERMRNGVSSADLALMKKALYDNFGTFMAGAATPGGSATIPKNNPWVKWESGNSTYAAAFYS